MFRTISPWDADAADGSVPGVPIFEAVLNDFSACLSVQHIYLMIFQLLSLDIFLLGSDMSDLNGQVLPGEEGCATCPEPRLIFVSAKCFGLTGFFRH